PHHVGHHVERHRQVLVEHPRVHGRALLVRAGVELGAHAVEQLVDLRRAVARRAAEQHVLEEVREAGLGLGLTARAGAHEEPEGRGPDGGHDLRDDPQPRVELGQAVFRQLVAVRIAIRARAALAAATGPAVAVAPAPAAAVAAAASVTARAAVAAVAAPATAAAGADAGQLLDGLAGDLRVLGQAQADAPALAVDLDHAHGDLVALVEDLLHR